MIDKKIFLTYTLMYSILYIQNGGQLFFHCSLGEMKQCDSSPLSQHAFFYNSLQTAAVTDLSLFRLRLSDSPSVVIHLKSPTVCLFWTRFSRCAFETEKDSLSLSVPQMSHALLVISS